MKKEQKFQGFELISIQRQRVYTPVYIKCSPVNKFLNETSENKNLTLTYPLIVFGWLKSKIKHIYIYLSEVHILLIAKQTLLIETL